MKKFIIFIMCAFFALPSMAQIQIQMTDKTVHDNVTKFRAGTQKLTYTSSNDYSGYMIVLTTTNQFDDPFIIFIGENANIAIESLNGLFYLCNNLKKGEFVDFDDCLGQSIHVMYSKMFGAQYISLSKQGCAGSAYITKKEIEILIDAIKKHSKN